MLHFQCAQEFLLEHCIAAEMQSRWQSGASRTRARTSAVIRVRIRAIRRQHTVGANGSEHALPTGVRSGRGDSTWQRAQAIDRELPLARILKIMAVSECRCRNSRRRDMTRGINVCCRCRCCRRRHCAEQTTHEPAQRQVGLVDQILTQKLLLLGLRAIIKSESKSEDEDATSSAKSNINQNRHWALVGNQPRTISAASRASAFGGIASTNAD